MYKREKITSCFTSLAKRKAQVDIIGLMIVVILIVIGGLFYIKYGVLGEKKDTRDPSLDTNYAINLLNSVLNVNVCDQKVKFGDGFVECFNGGKICEEEACGYLKIQTKEIINSVGLKDYKQYSLWIEKSGETKYLANDCKTGIKADELIKTVDNDEYTVNFRIC